MEYVFRIDKHIYYLTDENGRTKLDSIDNKKSEKFKESFYKFGVDRSGINGLTRIGHISSSDYDGASVFAKQFFESISSSEYSQLRDIVLTKKYKMAPTKYVHVSIYEVK